ncbi:MAG TPA: hypothetical protein VID26_11450 [Candidatus Limnocylindrales bacterium]|jgi:hypothetical protein
MTQPDRFDDAVRRMLSASADGHVPADLAAGVLEDTAGRRQRRGWFRGPPMVGRIATLAALAAVVVIIVIGLAPSLRGPASPAASTPGATSAPSFRLTADGLSLAVPAGWKVTKQNLELHYETILAYVGTGTGSMTCGSDYIPGLGGTCVQTLNLPANSIVVKVSSWDGPPDPKGMVNYLRSSDPGASPVVVGEEAGVVETIPLAQADEHDGADTVLEWTFQRPGGDPNRHYTVEAYLKGPDDSSIRAQLNALIASITTGN